MTCTAIRGCWYSTSKAKAMHSQSRSACSHRSHRITHHPKVIQHNSPGWIYEEINATGNGCRGVPQQAYEALVAKVDIIQHQQPISRPSRRAPILPLKRFDAPEILSSMDLCAVSTQPVAGVASDYHGSIAHPRTRSKQQCLQSEDIHNDMCIRINLAK